ncbi:MAG TPA: protein kinase, partial [Myxococcaceae bacterium]|nr:protein kinase [Myxococcaceae bacterium]
MPSKVRYQALGPLLSGEGSRAFLGLQISEEGRARPVVLVWVPEATASDQALVAHLHGETQRAAALQHPNIIRVFGLVALEDGLARVVEFADGESLRKVLDATGALPPHLAAFVAAEVAAGVHFAHLTGNADGTPLLHGDIRPETVMVSFNGTCKMTGYGALSVAPREVGGKRVKGRRHHCAPEQVLGGRELVTPETDVYLLGLLLYECLTGLVPFGDEPDFDKAVVNKPLDLERESIPKPLVGVLAKATAKRANARFPTALAFREAIERAMGGLATNEELAAYLKPFFPEADHVRAARRREIDAGIAELARRQWEEAGQRGEPPPPPPPPLPAPVYVPPPLPRRTGEHELPIRRTGEHAPPVRGSGEAGKPGGHPWPPPPPRGLGQPAKPEVPAPSRPEEAPPAAPAPAVPQAAAPVPAAPKSRRGWLLPALVGASLAFGLAGLAFGLLQSRSSAPTPSAPAPSVPVAQAPAPTPSTEPPSPPPSAAPGVTPAPTPVADAKPPPEAPKPSPETPAPAAPTEPPPPPKPPPEPPSLEL